MKEIRLVAILSFLLILSVLSACTIGMKNEEPTTSLSDTTITPGGIATNAMNQSDDSKNVADAKCSDESKNEKIPNIVVKELFEKAVKEIIALASEDPADIVRKVYGDDVKFFNEYKDIDGVAFYKTSVMYSELRDYYSDVFIGDALDWILSVKFANVDGSLYISPVGGATGWSITNVEISNISQDSEIYIYEATFNRVDKIICEEITTSQFTIEETENRYKISSIDYLSCLF